MLTRPLCAGLSVAAVGACLAPGAASAQTVWCGAPTTFVQPAIGVADVLTPLVALNRSFSAGLYNSAQESGYSGIAGSPAGTRWAFGTASERASLTFRPWREAVSNNPPAMVGRDMVVHLISEDVYVDVRFTAWAQASGAGSRFSYVRSTEGPCGGPLTCDPGEFGAGGVEPCSACPAGTIAPSAGATACEACPVGTSANADRTACVTTTGPAVPSLPAAATGALLAALLALGAAAAGGRAATTRR
jgi:Tyrosine-protein kinase ephrin type A/B receptor-like